MSASLPPEPVVTPAVPAVGDAPRALTPAVRRRSWAEPRVRFWIAAAAVFVIAAILLGIGQYRDWSYDSWLVHNGTLVDATIASVEGVSRRGFQVPPPADVEVEFTINGQAEREHGRIEPADGFKFVSPQTSIRLRVDPDQPKKWTARIEADSLARQFIGAGLLLIVAAVALGVALWKRRNLLRNWRDGELFEGRVEQVGRSATAPRSWCVRWRLPGDGTRNKRLYVAYIPQRAGQITPGQTLQLLGQPRRPQTALAVRAYQETSRQ